MTRVISVISGKGGVGKTTIAVNLSIALAKRNLKTCLIDADIAMANTSLLLNMQNSPITLHDVLLGEAAVHDAVYDGPNGLKFVPSGLSLESYRRVDSDRLHAIIDALRPEFDFIILDCAAGIEKNVLAAISSSDEVILVTMPTSPSIADVLKAKITAQRLGAKPIGVILNFVRDEKGEVKKEDIMKILELPVIGSVPYDDEVRKSFLHENMRPFIISSPNCPASVSVNKIAAKISGLPLVQEEKKKGFLDGFINALLNIFKGKK
ncbi:MAG: cell division ATPase MinD [Candidatus Diapherotrites archaeon]